MEKEETTGIATQKAMLTAVEMCNYFGIKRSYLYKLTHRKVIPHYKPFGKMIYFDKGEVDQWLKNNRVSTEEELSERANNYMMEKGGVK